MDISSIWEGIVNGLFLQNPRPMDIDVYNASVNQLSLGTLLSYFINFFDELGKVLEYLIEAIVYLPSIFLSVFPPAISALIVSMVSVAVIYKVVGRE